MKASFLIILVVLVPFGAYSQDLDSLKLAIIELKYQRVMFQKELDSIDLQILDIEKRIHEQRLLSAEKGFKGKVYSQLDLYKTPSLSGKKVTLASIPKNTILLVLGEINGFYKTNYNGVNGYIRSYQFTLDKYEDKAFLHSQAIEISDEILKAEQEEKAQKEREQALKKVQDIRSKYSDKTAQRLLDKEIWIGMTEEMLYYSRGYPNETTRQVGSWGIHKTCIYGEFPNCTYRFIKNGKLTGWSD